MKGTVKSLKHFSEKSEEIFKLYRFDNPEEIFYCLDVTIVDFRHKSKNVQFI